MSVNETKNLAIIGVGISSFRLSGLDQFGYEIYRGIPFSGNTRPKTLKEIAKSALDQLSEKLGSELLHAPFILMNQTLVDLIHEEFVGENTILPGSSLIEVFQTARIFLEEKSEIVVIADLLPTQGIISLLVVCLPEVAAIKSYTNLGVITESKDSLESSELLIVEGNLPEFVRQVSGSTLSSMFHNREKATCALSTSEPGLLAIIKLAWCLANRVIPTVPEWELRELSKDWENLPFYVPMESRAWFIPDNQMERISSLATSDKRGDLSFLTIKKYREGAVSQVNPPQLEELCLFPFAFDSVEDLTAQLAIFKKTDFSQVSLRQAARFQYRRWQKKQSSNLTICLLGCNPDELNQEIDYALNGIPEAIERSTDWRTPLGSTFTPNPLGNSGTIAFVYPGAFNSYPGVGRDLFYLFPTLYDRLSRISRNIGNLLNERQLYPRSVTRITSEDLVTLEKELTADPLAMLISGTCLAAVYTFLLRETFDIHPASSFGYSLGEISMMFSSSVWRKADETSIALRESPLFHTRMAGEQNAVREYWSKTLGLPEGNSEKIWANFVLMANYEKVKNAIQPSDRVYITHINTPRQVVIGGYPPDCRNLISRLKCSSLEAPFNYALHCEPMQSEYEALRVLHSWEVQNDPGMILFSAATNQPMPINQEDISQQIAYGLCHLLDFPHLVEAVYAQGARIFIELGAGSNCARWVDESLPGLPHAAFSINRKGVDDYSAILQLVAKLVSHNVTINLSAIYG